MRILITGATGFLGSRTLEFFHKKEEFLEIVATGRKFSQHPKLEHPKVHYLLGDLEDLSFVDSLFSKKLDLIINCASLSSPWGSYSEFYSANILSQKNLLQKAKEKGVKKFIYISSPSVYFNYKDQISIEEIDSKPQKAVNHYAKTKLEAEKMLQNSGLNFIILRPRALIGRGDTVIMPRLIRSYKEGRLKIIGKGNNQVDLTSVYNMVNSIYLSAKAKESSWNEDYNISNGKPMSLWVAINSVLEHLGFERIKAKMPYGFLMIIAQIMEWNALFIRKSTEPVLTKYSVGTLAKSFSFSIEKAKKKLGYIPQQSTDEAILEFVEWYKTKEEDNATI